jgi:acetoacetate decarboxylase
MDALNPPDPPWILDGSGISALDLVRMDRCSGFLPSGVEPVAVLPKRTVAGFFVGRYGRGSTLEYSELIAVCALVRAAGRYGFWVSHIYVDHELSRAGGRQIWGLPKELAEFDWTEGGVTVRRSGVPLLDVSWRWPVPGIPLRGWVPVLSARNGQLMDFRGTGNTRARLVRARWRSQGELDKLAIRPFLSVWLPKLRVEVSEPRAFMNIP